MKKLVVAFMFVLMAGTGFAQNTFKQDVVKYLELSGQKKTFEMITKDIITNVPAAKQEAFKKDLDASISDLMNKMADVYMTEISHEDIKAAIKFYESPAGKRISGKSEALYTKAQAVGQEWGMGLQEKVMKYMQ